MLSITYVSNGYVFYALTYLELWPEYICPEEVAKDDCNNKYKCLHPTETLIDWESTRSLHNWVETLSLECVEPYRIGLLGSMYFAGWTVACVFIPRLGDLYGRRFPYLISSGLSVFVYLGLILSSNLTLSTIFFFMLGLCCVGKSNLCYVYLLEFIPLRWQVYVGTFLLFLDGSTMIIISLYFRYMSRDWLYFQICGCCATAMAFLGSLIVPESPRYLQSVKRFKEAKVAL